MKAIKLFFLIIAPGILSIPTVKAQNTPVSLGIKAGLNLASLQSKVTNISENNWKIGYNTGVFAQIGIGKRWYLQPELNYRRLQNEYKFDGKNYNPTFHQLNLPLTIGYKLINKESIKFRLSAGPDLTYNLNKPEAPSAIEYKRFIVGAVLDAGVDLGNFSIDAIFTGNITFTTKFNADDLKKNDNDRGIVTLSVSYKIL